MKAWVCFILAVAPLAARQKASLWIRVDSAAEQNVTLSLPIAAAPPGLAAIFARATGCRESDLDSTGGGYQMSARCRIKQPDLLRVRVDADFGELGSALRQAGVDSLDVYVQMPNAPPVARSPELIDHRGIFGSYYTAAYTLEQPLPGLFMARMTRANGMPFEWNGPLAWMISHPSTMDRVQAVARAGQVPNSRIAGLLLETVPADRYVDGHAAGVPVDSEAAFSPALQRMMTGLLGWYALLAPTVIGLTAAWLLELVAGPSWLTFPVGVAFSMVVFNLGYEWLTGHFRSKAR